MPQDARMDGIKSHTQQIGNKRSLTNVSNSHRPRKRRRNGTERNDQDLATTGNKYAALTHGAGIDSDSMNSLHAPSAGDHNQSEDLNGTGAMSTADLGRNRLAMGFVKPRRNYQDSRSSGEISDSSSANIGLGKSSVSPIEISDDEMEESEGGIVLNVDQDNSSVQEPSSDDSDARESGEIATTPKAAMATSANSADLFTLDPAPSTSIKRLTDLSPEQLEDQLRYAFFHLDRQQIDLSRPVICLVCANEGHLYHDCEDEKQSIFPKPKARSKNQVKLWISCCVCGDKTHLVGDCPQARDSGATRWSLKYVSSENIINMSLETGTQRLEQEAKNRGLRPAGLQIKGRAGLHSTKAPQGRVSSDEDDEPFLRRPVGRKQPDNSNFPRPQRYDRYDAPTNNQAYRGGGEWYSTDSFGRRRSRSPDDRFDNYRPRDGFARSRESPQRDSWRPPPNERRDEYRPRQDSPPRRDRDNAVPSRDQPANNPTSGFQFSLPTRKGSNRWSQTGQGGGSAPAMNGRRADARARNRKKAKK